MRIPLFKPHFPEPTRRAVTSDIDAILSTGKLMMGPHKDALEDGLRRACAREHAVSVNTCTTALTICLKHFGAEGGEILVPSGTFLTSVSSVLFAGGTPVLVDMNPETLSFDLADLRRKLTPRTKGLVWVHLTGVISPEYKEILAFAKENGLFVIEDCAHALGARVPEGPAGSLGDAGCLSFYPTKIVTSGTGGAIVTDDAALARFAVKMRLFCKDPETQAIDGLGNDWFLDEIRACVAQHQLALLDEQLARRRAVAAAYDAALAGTPGLRLLHLPQGNLSSYYQYPVFLDQGIDHAALTKALAANHGVQAKKIYVPTHEENCFRHLDDGSLGRTAATLHASLCLPVYVTMSDEEIRTVTDGLKAELAVLR